MDCLELFDNNDRQISFGYFSSLKTENESFYSGGLSNVEVGYQNL